MGGSCKYIYFFSISVCLSQYCPDYLDSCQEDISLDASLCSLPIIQSACPTTCKIIGNGTDCWNWQDDCELFIYTNWIAFLFYGTILFLLLIISILAYSVCVDPKPSYERGSLKRSPKKKVDHIDLVPFSGKRLLQENIDSQFTSSSGLMNPNEADRKRSIAMASTVTDPIQDILSSDSIMEQKRDVCPNVEENKLAKNNSYPPMEFKVEQRNLLDQVKPSYTVEDEGYYDPDDDFFKHALIDRNDDFFEDPEPPPPPRVGGPRKSQALSKKLEARNKAISKNPEKFIQGNQDIALMQRKPVRKSESSCEIDSKTSSKISTPRAKNPKNYKLNPSFEAHQSGQSNSSSKMSRSGKFNSITDFDKKESGIILPSASLMQTLSKESKEFEHPSQKPSIDNKNDSEQPDKKSKLEKSTNIVAKSINHEDTMTQIAEYPKSDDTPPNYQTPRKLRKKRNDVVSVYELNSSDEMNLANIRRNSSTDLTIKNRLSELKESIHEYPESPTDGS